MSSASYRNRSIEIYPHERSPWRVDLKFANTLGSVLQIKVDTHDTYLYSLESASSQPMLPTSVKCVASAITSTGRASGNGCSPAQTLVTSSW